MVNSLFDLESLRAFLKKVDPYWVYTEDFAVPASWVPFDLSQFQKKCIKYLLDTPEKVDKELLRFMKSRLSTDMLASQKHQYDGPIMHLPQKLISYLENMASSDIISMICSLNVNVSFIYVDETRHHPINITNHQQPLAELIFVIIEPGKKVTLSDVLNLTQKIKIRAIVGIIGEHAQVEMIADHDYETSFGIFAETWFLARAAQLTTITGHTGGEQTWSVKEYHLADEAVLEHCTFSAVQGSEQTALITKQLHSGVKSRSSVLVKSLLRDAAHSFYRGTINIQEKAAHSEADQQQKALLMNPTARTCAIPSLEVSTHEVKCRHGSAAGKFNREELWYLAARGLDAEQSVNLLIEGFYNEPLLDEECDLTASLKERLKSRATCELRQ